MRCFVWVLILNEEHTRCSYSLRAPVPSWLSRRSGGSGRNLYVVSKRGGVQRVQRLSLLRLPQDKLWDTGKQRITCSLDTTSTPQFTTIAWLHLSTCNNTIALRTNTKRRTREYETGLTYHGII
jgi:hypothetical protein